MNLCSIKNMIQLSKLDLQDAITSFSRKDHVTLNNMEAQVRDYVNKCQICKKSKISTKKYDIIPEPDILYDPGEVIQINLFGPWSFTDIDGIGKMLPLDASIRFATISYSTCLCDW